MERWQYNEPKDKAKEGRLEVGSKGQKRWREKWAIEARAG